MADRGPGIAEFQAVYNRPLSVLNQNGTLEHIGQVMNVPEVRSVNCTADQFAAFSQEVLVDVEGDPQTVSGLELKIFRAIFLATYNKLTAQLCNPKFKQFEDISVNDDLVELGGEYEDEDDDDSGNSTR